MNVPKPEAEKEIVESKPEVKPPVRKSVSKPAIRKSTPPPSRQEPRQETVNNEIVFSSSPTGASIMVNDQRMGTTPFTWSKPFFGKVNVQISKTGYKSAQKSFEFTGGSMRESFSLEKEVAVAPPPPPPEPVERVQQPTRQEPTKTVVQSTQSTPVKRTPPPPSADEDDPFADIGEGEDDFSFESESETPAAVSRPQTTPTRTTTTAPAAVRTTPPAISSSGGGEALIFIASIPPVADVFLNDKLIGKTNVSELKIPAGVQTLKFVKGGKEITKQINLQPGKNPSQMVRIP